MHRKAFTLIELAIVIVLIALVVSLVATGDRLVRDSSLKKYIFDSDKLITAYNEFQVTYGDIPGDSPIGATLFPYGCVTAADYNGNGNGQVDFYFISDTDEVAAAMRMLNLAGLIDDGGEIQPGSHIPISDTGRSGYFPQSINGAGLAIIGASAANSNSICSTGGNNVSHLFLDRGKNAVYLIKSVRLDYCRGGISPIEAFNVDKKLDDGRTSSGNAIGASTGKFRASIDKSNDACVSGDVYQTSLPDESCLVGRQID